MNKNISNDSRNQFMNESSFSQQNKRQDLQAMMRLMKSYITSQKLMQTLQQHLKDKEMLGSKIINQSLYNQQNMIQSRKTYCRQYNQNKIPQRIERNYQLNQQFEQQQIKTSIINKDNRKKGTDVLMKYINNTNLNQQQQTFNNKKTLHTQQFIPTAKNINDFDDRPINSNYHNAFLNQEADKKIHDVSVPAQYPNMSSIYTDNFKSNNQKNLGAKHVELLNNKQKKQKSIQSNKYNSYQQIPISQLKLQFKNSLEHQSPFLNQQFESQKGNYQNQQQTHSQKPIKQFLKRGSRQYLSSAKDRSPITKKNATNADQPMNSSYLKQDKFQKRDASQNRILAKRVNNSHNEKSKTKGNNQNNLNCSLNKSSLVEVESQTNPRRSITPKKVKPPVSKPIIQIKQDTEKIIIPQRSTKKQKNIFQDQSSDEQQIKNESQQIRKNNFIPSSYSTKQSSNQKQFDIFSRQKKTEAIEGVYLTQTQLSQIIRKYGRPVNKQPDNQSNKRQSKQIIQLRNKYTDLCHVVQQQKQQFQEQIQKKRQEFQIYKANQLTKLKNQKRVMERQLKSSMPSHSHSNQRDREQVQNIKKQLQKQKQDHKKKQKNNKILIEKYKKQNQDFKLKCQSLQSQLIEYKQHQLSSTKTNYLSSSKINNNPNVQTSNKIKKQRSLSPSVSSKKSVAKNIQNFEQDYKQTVPLNANKKSSKLTKSLKNGNDSEIEFNTDINQNQDEYLPTFKVTKNQQKMQKKYEYVQTNQTNNNSKGNKKNAFAKSSQSEDNDIQSFQNQQNEAKSNYSNQNSNKCVQLADLNKGDISVKIISTKQIQRLFKYQNNFQYKKYLEIISNPKRQVTNSSKNVADKKITNVYNDQAKQVLFQNGVKKQFLANGYTIIYFKNGDIKQKLVDGTILYYFKQKQVDQITLPNGLNIYRFDNNQVQFHFNSGYIEIRHPDGTIKVIETQRQVK